MNERISILIDSLGISKSDFAKRLNTSKGRISNITTGRNKPDSQIIAAIIMEFRNLNPLWLLVGDEPMFIDDNSDNPNDNPNDNLITQDPTQDDQTVQRNSTFSGLSKANKMVLEEIINLGIFDFQTKLEDMTESQIIETLSVKVITYCSELKILTKEITLLRDNLQMKDKYIALLEDRKKTTPKPPK